MKRLIDIECSVCSLFETDVWREPGQYGECACGAPMVRVWHDMKTGGVIQDSIEGGIDIAHGICYPDGTPKRYYSKSEIARAAKAAGWSQNVEHVATPGSDKAPWTSRWT